MMLYVQGRITLLLGPPGAGKTVFLKILAGQLPSSPYVQRTGSVKYNGHVQASACNLSCQRSPYDMT